MSSYMKTTIYGKLHQNLRGAVHLLCQMRWIDPLNMRQGSQVPSTKVMKVVWYDTVELFGGRRVMHV